MRGIYGMSLVALLFTGCATFTIVNNEIPADFSLEVSTPPRITQGTTVTIPISVVRSKTSTSDIQITMNGAPQGVTATPLSIPATATTGNLEITVEPTAPQGPFTVTLEARVGTRMSTTTSLSLFVRGPAGSLDTTFATGGRLTVVGGLASASSAIAGFVSEDDHIFMIGGCLGGSGACVTRLTSEGALDTDYGKNGIATLTGLNQTSAALLPDGRVIVGGGSSGKAAYNVVSADGTIVGFPDGTGVGSPIAIGTTPDVATGVNVQSMALAPDGGTVIVFDAKIGKTSTLVMGLTKLKKDGQIDTTFGTNGLASADFSQNPTQNAYSASHGVAVRSDGNIVITGIWCTVTDCPPSDVEGHVLTGYGILQFKGDGTDYDTSFGDGNGRKLFPKLFSTGTKGIPSAGPVLLNDGRVVSPAGDADGTVVAFTKDGTGLDPAFGVDGQVFIKGDTPDPPHVFLDDQNQDRLLVTTVTTGALESVTRITLAGENDTSFGVDGHTAIPLPGATLQAQPVVARVQKDGRIVVFSNVPGPNSGVVVSRLWN